MKTNNFFGLSIAPASRILSDFLPTRCANLSNEEYNFSILKKALNDYSIFIMHPRRWIAEWSNNLFKQCQPKYYVKAFSLFQTVSIRK